MVRVTAKPNGVSTQISGPGVLTPELGGASTPGCPERRGRTGARCPVRHQDPALPLTSHCPRGNGVLHRWNNAGGPGTLQLS